MNGLEIHLSTNFYVMAGVNHLADHGFFNLLQVGPKLIN